jgi:hypothetical protein
MAYAALESCRFGRGAAERAFVVTYPRRHGFGTFALGAFGPSNSIDGTERSAGLTIIRPHPPTDSGIVNYWRAANPLSQKSTSGVALSNA